MSPRIECSHVVVFPSCPASLFALPTLFNITVRAARGLNEWAHMIEFVIPRALYIRHNSTRRSSSSFNMNSIIQHTEKHTWKPLCFIFLLWDNIIWFFYIFFLSKYSCPLLFTLRSRFFSVRSKTTPSNVNSKLISRMSRDYECFTSDKILNTDDTYRHALSERPPDFLRSHQSCEWVVSMLSTRLTTMSDEMRGIVGKKKTTQQSRVRASARRGAKRKRKNDFNSLAMRAAEESDENSRRSRCREIYWFFFLSREDESWKCDMTREKCKKRVTNESSFAESFLLHWTSWCVQQPEKQRGEKNFIERRQVLQVNRSSENKLSSWTCVVCIPHETYILTEQISTFQFYETTK